MNRTIRRRPRVSTIDQNGKIAYMFACGLCDQGPLLGRKFRAHLVDEHGMRKRTALNLIAVTARRHKERMAALLATAMKVAP